jgi:hypothetical protein
LPRNTPPKPAARGFASRQCLHCRCSPSHILDLFFSDFRIQTSLPCYPSEISLAHPFRWCQGLESYAGRPAESGIRKRVGGNSIVRSIHSPGVHAWVSVRTTTCTRPSGRSPREPMKALKGLIDHSLQSHDPAVNGWAIKGAHRCLVQQAWSGLQTMGVMPGAEARGNA